MEIIREVPNNVRMCFVVVTWGQDQPLTQRDLGDDTDKTMNVQIWGKMGKGTGGVWKLSVIKNKKWSQIVRIYSWYLIDDENVPCLI